MDCDKLSKLSAQKRVAQISAYSGEFLHSNIRFAMEYLNEAPPEAQQSLLKTLIKTITIHEDHVEMRLYVGRPLEDMALHLQPPIPENNAGNTPQNAKCATEKSCDASSTTAQGSTERPKWWAIQDSNL